ncbi:MAG: DUF99 family protein [Aigarchaeota archaeon]|nr:DUF99 family protein [Candidatus Calditenuis fumarioli]
MQEIEPRVRPFDPHKRGYRVMGVAESFSPDQPTATLGAVVMRADLIVDGVALGRCRVMGTDATEAVISLYRSLGRDDVNLILLGGCIISLFNVVRVREVASATGLPVVCVTYNPSEGLEEVLVRRFGPDAEERLAAYRELGGREELRLKTGYTVYVRRVGVSRRATEVMLNSLTVSGRVPEPVRLAKLVARAARSFLGSSP